MTAPPGETWTCRNPPTTAPTTAAALPAVTPLPLVGVRDAEFEQTENVEIEKREVEETFERTSGGRGNITLDQYLAWFGASDVEPVKVMTAKFEQHDLDGYGVLTFEEAGRLA